MTVALHDRSRRRVPGLGLLLLALLLRGPAAHAGTKEAPCPPGAIPIVAGAAIQPIVDALGNDAEFCLKNGIHRLQAVRPRRGQRFFGEGRTILNGSRILSGFDKEGGHWSIVTPLHKRPAHGECLPQSPLCDQPEAVFVDDRPLKRVPAMAALTADTFYIDHERSTLHLAVDPAGRKVELAVTPFAFESTATDVLIRNVTVEKFASPAQKGAIHGREGLRWTVSDCEVRLNSGAGISIGTGGRVRGCDIDNNGQIGIEGKGGDILIEANRIWSNNIHGFDATWEAGGVKIAMSDGVTFRTNHVHDNDGPGLWCDIDCRNVLYEGNLVERNRDIGIFHEISFEAVIRDNVLRHNGLGDRGWFWASDIVIAASENVEVSGNAVLVAPGRCGIVLIDQGRRSDDGRVYKTRNNSVIANVMTFEGAACAGGVSDTRPGHENYSIISDGNNRFDGNTYHARPPDADHFIWGRELTDWDGFRRTGQETNGRIVPP